jgi:CotS family spore coat protein
MKEMEGLKRKVENDFGFNIKTWDIVTHEKNSSFVARIVTEEGKKKALKSLYITPERQLFIVNSEQMLAEKAVDLARPTPTVKGNLYMIYNRVPYVLYEWIDGKNNQLHNRDDLESLVQVMARFHYASRELDYPPDLKVYSHLHWEKEYNHRLKTIKCWFNTHKASKKRKDVIISRHIPFFYKIAQKALNALKRSRYQNYMDGLVTAKSLVHGDFHNMNLIFKGNAGVLIDFEDIRYDLPSKDLLRIFSMHLKKHPFSGKVFCSMLKTYENIHPLHSEVKQLVCIDFLFPHIFERMLRKKKYTKMSDIQLEDRIRQEKKKAEYVYRFFVKNKAIEHGRDYFEKNCFCPPKLSSSVLDSGTTFQFGETGKKIRNHLS